MKSWFGLIALSLLPGFASAQDFGRIVGRVVDRETGQGLSSVTVQIVGTNLGALTAIDGRFAIARVPAGPMALRVSTIGYGVKNITDVQVKPGATVEQNIVLDQQAMAMAAIEVTAAAERGSVNRALDQQRMAVGIVNAVTAEQISRSPDSDAAAAVQRVAGVTLMDNKFVQVRGLGERYTTTSLNGARIPSPEPEKKLVPLDLFPTGLLETITTAKTFTPDLPGDFSGAQVDIKTRDFPSERRQTVSTSVGFNNAARTLFAAPGTSTDWLGFGTSHRQLPANLRAAGNFDRAPTQADINAYVNSLRNAWSARPVSGRPNTSFAMSAGGNSEVFGQRMGYVVSGTYAYGQEVRDHEVRAQAQPEDHGGTSEKDRYEGATGRTSVLWGGLLNASTLVGNRSRIALTTTYNRSADNEARSELGVNENYGGLPLQVTRLRYVERSVHSAQLAGEHEPSGQQRIEWKVTVSGVTRVEPDRSEIVYSIDADPATGRELAPAWFSSSGEGAVRTYGHLHENAAELSASYRILLGRAGHALKIGALYRAIDRAADNRAYSITAPLLPRTARELSAEEIFDGRFTAGSESLFRIAPLSQGGSYDAADRLAAGYAMLEWAPSDNLRIVTGARIEQSRVAIEAEPTIGAAIRATPDFTDVLPAFTLNYQLSERQNLRFSVSQTLSRPEYRELAEIQYRDVIGGDVVIGNPKLQRSLIRNADLRWELYPAAGEVLSVALFAKQFDDPIERVYLGTSGSRVVSFLNADGAHNYGLELEARKRLPHGLTTFVNATIIESQIEIDDPRAMVGQSPYVVNVGTTYASASGAVSATALYNVTGKRIVSAAERPLPDVYEQARQVVDLALRFPLNRRLAGRIDLKNVLDSPYHATQGVATREYYTSGRVLSFGLTLHK